MTGLLGATLSEQTTFVSACLYGPEGTGKTTDALRLTKVCKKGQRILLVNAEAGAKVEALRQRGVDVSKVEIWPKPEDGGAAALTYEGLETLAEGLAKEAAKYAGVVWDSGTEITRLILDQVVEEAKVRDQRLGKQRARFQVNLDDHGTASAALRMLLRKFRNLPMHFVITALERRDIDEDTGKVRYGPAMAPAMANDTAGLVDIVGYTMVEEVGNEEIRSARFVPRERRRAKDRFGLLPAKLADPYMDRIIAYINGDLAKGNDPVQAHVRELLQAAAAPAQPATADAAEPKKEAASAQAG